MALFSIIVPVYNVENDLKRCVDSILNQTFKDFELLLVDDGSKDNSGKICDEYEKKDKRVRVIHKKNGGVSSARNVGLDYAKGKYIGFVDSDDYVNEDYLEKLYNPEVDMVCCGMKYKRLDGNDKILSSNLCGIFNIEGRTIKSMLESKYINPVYSKMYQNYIIQENNIRFKENVSLGEDTVFLVDYISCIKNVQLKKDVVYNYIQYERETLSTFNENSIYCLELLDEYVEKNLLEKYNIRSSVEFLRRKWEKYEYVVFQALRSKELRFNKKRKILSEIFQNKNYIELVNNIDDCMPKDTKIVRNILSTRNTIIVIGFFSLCDLKSKIFK